MTLQEHFERCAINRRDELGETACRAAAQASPTRDRAGADRSRRTGRRSAVAIAFYTRLPLRSRRRSTAPRWRAPAGRAAGRRADRRARRRSPTGSPSGSTCRRSSARRSRSAPRCCSPAACTRTGSPTRRTVSAAAPPASRALDIMRDSRIGAYGACALGICAVRCASARSPTCPTRALVACALIGAHAAARASLPASCG